MDNMGGLRKLYYIDADDFISLVKAENDLYTLTLENGAVIKEIKFTDGTGKISETDEISDNGSVYNFETSCRIPKYGPDNKDLLGDLQYKKLLILGEDNNENFWLAGAPGSYFKISTEDLNNRQLKISAALMAGVVFIVNPFYVPIENVLVDDWFLPSKDEFQAVHDNLYLYGVGDIELIGNEYWTSSEFDESNIYSLIVGFGETVWAYQSKGLSRPARACRAFTTTDLYSLRDRGPAGGWIFHIIDNGGGSFTYYELASTDTSNGCLWSNIIDVAIGTTGTAIGTGQANTAAIIAQTTAVGVTDIDGNVYTHVVIGSLVWLVENLKTTKYRDGTSIPNLTSNANWIAATSGAYCWGENNIANKAVYGAIYNFYTLEYAHGLAPSGCRLATDVDYNNLMTELGGEAIAGGKMKEVGTSHWNTPNTGATNEYGLTFVPTYWRYDVTGDFFGWPYTGDWWLNAVTGANGKLFGLAYNAATSTATNYNKKAGMSVRCVRDYVVHTNSAAKLCDDLNIYI